MSDSNTYINTYIDHAMATIHEQVNVILQLKTNLKLATDLVKQKDEIIASLEGNTKVANTVNEDLNKVRQDYANLEQECIALRNKASHFDSLSNQFNDLKHELTKKIQECGNLKDEFVRKDEECNVLKMRIVELSKPQETVINTKSKITKSTKDKKEKLEDTDDF